MQPYYEKVFDSVNQVEHDRADKGKILSDQEHLRERRGTCQACESMFSVRIDRSLARCKLVIEMQKTLKALCGGGGAMRCYVPWRLRRRELRAIRAC